MTKRTGGVRARTRYKLSKKPRNRGKISTTAYMQTFEVGDRVLFRQEPAVHKGMPNPKFMGRAGVILAKQGRCYLVEFNDGNKVKHAISAPVHIRKVK